MNYDSVSSQSSEQLVTPYYFYVNLKKIVFALKELGAFQN